MNQIAILNQSLHEVKEDFTVVVSYDQIKDKNKNYSFSAGQYFDVKIDYVDISPEEFKEKMDGFKRNLDKMFSNSKILEKEISKQIEKLNYE